jgi:glycosyltransferase involved in cell wall biosynthesis
MTWHLITAEYPPQIGGVSDYSRLIAEGLADAGDDVHVWCPPHSAGADGLRVKIHPELGRIGPRDLRAVDCLLDGFATPRRLLVQWVPHGFGWHSMNLPFCLWVHRRARCGDRVELMVHEPFLGFRGGRIHHGVMAAIHRLMTIVLLNAASQIWVAIPAWEHLLRPYALGRRVAFDWLPVPSVISPGDLAAAANVRRKYAGPGNLIGHFGTFNPEVSRLLRERVPDLLAGRPSASLLLMGVGSERFQAELIGAYPDLRERVHGVGYVQASQLGAYLTACDLCVQPYPDGISTRRTTAMACLSLGVPMVTTHGHLTESFWVESNALSIVPTADAAGFTREAQRLLSDEHDRRRLAERSRSLYETLFSARHIVSALRNARSQTRSAA